MKDDVDEHEAIGCILIAATVAAWIFLIVMLIKYFT